MVHSAVVCLSPFLIFVFFCLFLSLFNFFAVYRKVAAQWYLTAEPQSKGSIKVLENGGLEIDGAYMKDPMDLTAAIRGVKKLIEVGVVVKPKLS